MAIRRGDSWYCSQCNTKYSDQAKADACRDSHELIYVPLTQTDLNRLMNFIYSKNEEYLTPTLMKTLTKYIRGNDVRS